MLTSIKLFCMEHIHGNSVSAIPVLNKGNSVCLVETVQCREQQPTSRSVEQLGYT